MDFRTRAHRRRVLRAAHDGHYVRGHFKDVHGSLNFDPKNPSASSVEVTIDARKIWTGEPARDAHLLSADFLDAKIFPEITFRAKEIAVDWRG